MLHDEKWSTGVLSDKSGLSSNSQGTRDLVVGFAKSNEEYEGFWERCERKQQGEFETATE